MDPAPGCYTLLGDDDLLRKFPQQVGRAAAGTASITVAVGVSIWAVMLLRGQLGARPVGIAHALALVLGASGILALVMACGGAMVGGIWPGSARARALFGRASRAQLDRACLRTSSIAAVAVVMEIAVAVALSGYARGHDEALLYLSLGSGAVGALLIGAAVFLAGPRLGARWHGLLHGLPALTPMVLWLALPGHVLAHEGVVWALVVAATLPYASLIRVRARMLLAGSTVALVCGLWLATGLGADRGIAAALRSHHDFVALAGYVGRHLTDFDDDGESSYFGGRDCAPFDPSIAPGRAEVAGNDVDENCILGDLADDRIRHGALQGTAKEHVVEGASLPNVLVLSVDALRPDRMSMFGYPRPTTPNIERWFGRSFRFKRGYAASSSTRDTLPSLLAGRHRAELLWYRHRAVTLDPRNRFLGHWLHDAGFTTFAVLPFVALNMMGASSLGFDETFDFKARRRDAASEVNRLLLEVIKEDQRFFAFAHYSEPHEPYLRHSRFKAVSTDAYDQEIAAVDEAIGALLTALEGRGVLRDTIVVLTGDHGEAFGEHGHYFHNSGVYEEDLRVPLLIRLPNEDGRVIEAPVSNGSVAATLLDLLGVELLDAGRRQVDEGPTLDSLVPLMWDEIDSGSAERSAQRSVAPVVAVSRATLEGERFALIDGGTKIIFDRALAWLEVYDLDADPGERRNLLDRDPDRVTAMVKMAAEFLEYRVGAAQSRARRIWQPDAPSLPRSLDLAAPIPSGEGVEFVDASAWLSIPVGAYHRLPMRIYVRSLFRRGTGAAIPEPYRVEVVSERGKAQTLAGIPFRGEYSLTTWPVDTLFEDIRTFKVYFEDRDAEIRVRVGGESFTLGRVRDLRVWDPG